MPCLRRVLSIRLKLPAGMHFFYFLHCPCLPAGMYEDERGWYVLYEPELFTVESEKDDVKFHYTGEAVGDNYVELRYIPDKQPQEVLTEEVDELVRKSGARFLNKSVNPAQWLMLEKELTTKVDELLAAKDYDGARKWVEAFAEIRAYSKSLSEAPAQAPEDTEDSLTVTDGKPSGLLGTAAVNVRIAKLREKLIAAVAAAKKADLDARMQKLINELKAKVIALVEEGKFDEARVVIRDVALVKDNEWDAKIYAMRIGLMNSIVNPNQLKHLKAEADKIINDFVAQKKYAEAIKYIDEYPYVHDTFAQIKASFDKIEKAMTGLKLDDGKSAEYVTSRLAAVRTLMEKRLGRYNSDDDFSELEKALGELEKGYVAQHYDSAAATNVTGTIKGEIIAMVDAMYAPITTWEMNEALRRFLASKRPRMPVAAPPADGDGVVPVVALPAPAMARRVTP